MPNTKKIVIFGGTGGLGKRLTPHFDIYDLLSIGSKDLDLTDSIAVRIFFEANDIDIILNFSGYNFNSPIHKYDETNIVERNRQIDVVINGNLNILSACLPKMREKNYGRIILASSVLSSSPVFGTSVYSGCKAFVDNLVKTCSVENLSKGITCNSLQLGYMDGGLTYRVPESLREKIFNNLPLKRWGHIEEIVSAIIFLIKTEYVSGISLKINGGINY